MPEMKILGGSTTYYVEYDGEEYRTSDGEYWEIRYPEAWESEYGIDKKLSAAFAVKKIGSGKPPTIKKPEDEIAQEIADEFFMPSTLLHRKLSVLIIRAIENERKDQT
jgi:hypothetical protein